MPILLVSEMVYAFVPSMLACISFATTLISPQLIFDQHSDISITSRIISPPISITLLLTHSPRLPLRSSRIHQIFQRQLYHFTPDHLPTSPHTLPFFCLKSPPLLTNDLPIRSNRSTQTVYPSLSSHGNILPQLIPPILLFTLDLFIIWDRTSESSNCTHPSKVVLARLANNRFLGLILIPVDGLC